MYLRSSSLLGKSYTRSSLIENNDVLSDLAGSRGSIFFEILKSTSLDRLKENERRVNEGETNEKKVKKKPSSSQIVRLWLLECEKVSAEH
jgi:hypothetical protein